MMSLSNETKIDFLKDPFEHIIIKNFFNDNELFNVWSELEFLYNTGVIKREEEGNLSAATTFDGISKASRKGIFLSQFFQDHRSHSLIYRHLKNIYTSRFNILDRSPLLGKYLRIAVDDVTLVNVYDDGDYYKSHYDQATVSALIFLWGEKRFSGGDLVFEEFDNYTIIPENNMCVIFPSACSHEVTPIKKIEEQEDGLNLRISLAYFAHPK